MKELYLDCNMGAAGDMLSAALYELLTEEEKERFLAELLGAGIPEVEIKAKPGVSCGIGGTRFEVRVHGVEEESVDVHEHHHHHGEGHHKDHSDNDHHDHEHMDDEYHTHDHHNHDDQPHHDHHHPDHEHNDHHHHHHASMADIEHIVSGLKVSEKVKSDVINVYKLIAEAESSAHRTEVSEIHFHEVGMMDAIADITAVCLAMEYLKPERVTASWVRVGSGQVKCAHGILPVPAPATAWLLRDIPIYAGDYSGEFCTPTGAALLKYFVNGFGVMPAMKAERVGYGLGKKEFSAANVVRSLYGESEAGLPKSEETDQVVELSCNVDDMTGEEIGFCMERLFEAGALEVYTVLIGMKKERPGTMLCVLCRETDKEKITYAIFKHTTTIGIREKSYDRYVLDRSVKEMSKKFGTIRIKESTGYGAERKKAEFEDLARIAREQDLSIAKVRELIGIL